MAVLHDLTSTTLNAGGWNIALALFLGATASLGWTLYRRYRNSQELRLPFLRFEDGDDSRQRYATDSGTLFRIGYNKYLKHGQAFSMRNYVDELQPQVFLPLKYLHELKNAPEHKLSLKLFSELLFLQDYTGTAKQTDEAAHVLRTDLPRNLHLLFPIIAAETVPAVEKVFPLSPEWVSVTPFPLVSYAVARVAARVVVGPELCQNDEWLNLCIGITHTSMQAAHALRDSWPQWSRWAAPYLFQPVKTVRAQQRRAAELLGPVIEGRRKAAASQDYEDGAKYNDAVQWLLDYYQARKKKIPFELMAQNQLFYAIASIHSSTLITLSVLYDLIDERNRAARDVIIDEITQVQKEHPEWTRPAVSKLVKLDSFMKESQRLNFVGHVRVTRVAKVPYTFKDGLFIPKGTMLQILHSGHQLDADVFDEPERFDPWRFLRKRQVAGDENKFQFDSLSDIETEFGAGFHACPARNSATATIKLVLIRLLTQYDIKFDGDRQRRTPNIGHDSATFPNPATKILFRQRTPVSVA